MSKHCSVHPSTGRILSHGLNIFQQSLKRLCYLWTGKQSRSLTLQLKYWINLCNTVLELLSRFHPQPKDYFPWPETRAVNQCCPAHFRTEMLIYLEGKVTSLAQLSRGQVPQRLKSRAVFFSRNFK